MTKLEKIVKAAKELRKKYPNKYSKWTDYIKAASKQVAGFEGVSRKGDKTTVHYSKKSPATKKKAAPKKATQSTLFGVKKAAPKKKAPARSSHKDTKSHNVNIRVVSGYKSYDHYDVRNKMEKDLEKTANILKKAQDDYSKYKTQKFKSPAEKKWRLTLSREIIKDLKKILMMQKNKLKMQNNFLRKIEKLKQ